MYAQRKEFCDAISLFCQSELHRRWFLEDIPRLVTAPLQHGKMKIFYSELGVPEGLFSHLFFDDKDQVGFLEGSRRIQPEDWAKGPGEGTLWVVDMIAPFNNGSKIARRVQKDLSDLYYHTYDKDGAWMRRPAKGGHPRWVPGVLSKVEKRKKERLSHVA
jgi:hemolysin-activating ACP:hemolysin acyltransferase|tara:strand:+ start:157 stop:636 length:480 start_codon:yes stop_codon:yes gene_type:complete